VVAGIVWDVMIVGTVVTNAADRPTGVTAVEAPHVIGIAGRSREEGEEAVGRTTSWKVTTVADEVADVMTAMTAAATATAETAATAAIDAVTAGRIDSKGS